jgi:hypothetical protein
MPIRQLRVPHTEAYDFGIGVECLSGAAMNKVVGGEPSTVTRAGGSTQSFEVSRIRSTRELEEQLGIDIEASYGSATFGAGASARFSYMKKTEVQTSSLFLTVTATIHLADLSIDECVLTQSASAVVDRPDLFMGRYGDMFARACKRGGIFVGVMRVDTRTEEVANSIEAELKGSYGLFSAEATVNFRSVATSHDASVYCSLYSEGGPALRITDPADPAQLLGAANAWMQAMHDDPDRYGRPYEWILAPITIANGPAADPIRIQHGQDVLTFCARERTTLLDQLNLLQWIRNHPEHYDWNGAVTRDAVTTAARATQTDLDTIAACASAAINDPGAARMPAEFSGNRYPTASMPSPLPRALPGAPPPPEQPATPPGMVAIPNWPYGASVNAPSYGGEFATADGNRVWYPSAEEVGLVLRLVYEPPGAVGPYKVGSVSPPAGTLVPLGSPVTVTCVLA